MRKITSFILALALTLSLLVTAGAADPGKVDLVITPRAEKVDDNVLFDIYLEPNNVTEIAAFQFAVTAQGGKIIGVAYLNNGKYTEDGTSIQNPTNGGLVFYPDKVSATGFTNGYFEQFGGQRSGDGSTYKFVAAGTARVAYTDEDKNTSMPAHIWNDPEKTKIVTLKVQMDEDATECSLVADIATSSKFSVGTWGNNNTVSDNGTTGTPASTPYTPASPTGVTVRGTVTSFGNDTDKVTIYLMEQGKTEASYETVVQGKTASYSITNVASGAYTMKVMKQNHVTREYTITVGSNNVTQNAEISLLGDVNMDGNVDADDVTALLRHVSRIELLSSDYATVLGNVTGDTATDADDVTKLLRYVSRIIASLD